MPNTPILLDDAAMQQFIRDGYIILKPDFPEGFHKHIYDRLEQLFEKGGNPGNNLLPAVPQIQDVWDHPVVHGALSSILGPDYYLHLHRHVHESHPGTDDQRMHKDSLYNSRYAADHNRRHHHTRWLMAFYYPQDTPKALGPTAVIPNSQYLNTQDPPEDEIFTEGPAGTICIVHYDLRHRRVRNDLDYTRHMVKFLFTRMTEPTDPTWNHTGTLWQPSDDPQEPIYQAMWDWHRGIAPTLQPSGISVPEYAERLSDPDESIALPAAYQLGCEGAVPVLIDALKDQTDPNRARNAAYGFNRLGEYAVRALIETAQHPEPQIRARAVDVLGDMGPSARSATFALINTLNDPDEDVRARAAEALGTCGQDMPNLAASLSDTLITDDSDHVRRNAALSLARLGPNAADAVPQLTEALRDQSHYVRGFAVHALYRIGTPEALKAALTRLQTTRWDAEPTTPSRRSVPHQKTA